MMRKRSRIASVGVVLLLCIVGITPALALFTNGEFESGDFTSWTKSTFLNTGLSGSSPFSESSINRGAGGSDTSVIVGGAGVQPLSQDDPVVGAALKYPRFGNYAARVGDTTPNKNANSLIQQSVVSAGDIDPSDNLVHVRFTYAPVLENPGHSESEQPYFYIGVHNVTRGNALIYSNFKFAGQTGVPWQTAGGVQFTDWQLVDIAPGSNDLQVGDTIEIEVIAAGCSRGGHYGYVYVDGFGADIPGPRVTATAPSQVTAGQPLTYTFNYANGSNTTLNNAVITEVLPAQTTFASVSIPSDCLLVSGVLTCNVGDLAPNARGSFQVTVDVNILASGDITNGDYAIASTGFASLLGSVVTTTVNPAPVADLFMTVTDNQTTATTGSSVTYTVVVGNNGPAAASGALVNYTVPSQLTNVTWSCVIANGATCTASGTGSINDTVNLPAGATATYTIHGQVSPTATGNLVTNVMVTAPAGTNDSTPGNNTATDTNTVDVDTIPPAQPTIDSPSPTNNTKPIVFGTAEPNSTVTVGVDLTGNGTPDVSYTTTANGNGDWTIDTGTIAPTSGTFPNNGLGDGSYPVQATATDATGNVSPAATKTLVVDTAVPTIAIVTAEASSNRLPLISGTTEANSVVTAIIDLGNGATVTYRVPASASGAWAVEATTTPSSGSLPVNGLADGTYNVVATSTDTAGNTSLADSYALLVDRTPPPAPSIGSANRTDDRTPVFFGTAEPSAVLTVTVTLDNGDLLYRVSVDENGAWSMDTGTTASSGVSFPVGGLIDGDYAVTAVAEDGFNNQSESANQTLTIDATAPTPPTITSVPVTNDHSPVITGTSEANSTIHLVLDLGGSASVTYTVTANGSGNWSVNTGTATPTNGTFPAEGLSDDTYTLSATATDNTNNTSAAATQLLTVDTTLPTVIFTSPEITNDRTPSIGGIAEPGSTVTLVITFNDSTHVTYTTQAVQPSGAWSVDLATDPPSNGSFPTEGLADGSYTLSAVAADAADNAGPQANQVLTVDTGLPTVSITSLPVTKDRTPLLTGIAEANSAVTVMIDLDDGTNVVYNVPADADGVWSIDIGVATPANGSLPAGGLAPGNYNVRATATDAAGNVSPTDTQVLTIEDVTVAMPLVTSATRTPDTTPVISGQGDPGTTVIVELDLNGDGITDVTYIVPVDNNGQWSVDTSTTIPAIGSFSTDGIAIGSSIGVTITARDRYGNLSASSHITLSLRYVIFLPQISKA